MILIEHINSFSPSCLLILGLHVNACALCSCISLPVLVILIDMQYF